MPGGIFRSGPGRPVRLPAPGSSVPSPPGRPRLIPAPPASLTADRPRAAGAADLAAGQPDQAIARELAVALDTVKACRPRPGHARRGQPHRGRGPSPRTEPHPLTRHPSHWRAVDSGTRCRVETAGAVRALPSCVPRSPAGVTASPQRPGINAGQGYTLVPGAPRKIPPGMSPLGGRLARRIFLACGERNAHRKEEAQWPPPRPARPTAAPRSPAPPRPPPADPPLYPQPGGLRIRYSVLLSTGS